MVDVKGTGEEAEFTFKGVPKPEALPEPPVAVGAGEVQDRVEDTVGKQQQA